MKTFTSILLMIQSIILWGQQVVISGPEFLCINTYGTASVQGDTVYDTYQWYSKFSYDEDAIYEPIEGENSYSFSYNVDMNEYTIKVVVSLGNETFESNEIVLQTPWTTGILLAHSTDDPNYFYSDQTGHNICEGFGMRMEILSLWSHQVKWLKDDEIIAEGIGPIYVATETGYYGALCANDICPEDYYYSLGLPLMVNECNLSIDDANNYITDGKVYFTPSKDQMYLYQFKAFKIDFVEIYDLTGKQLKVQQIQENHSPISVNNLNPGIYILRVYGEGRIVNLKFLRK